MAELIDDKRDLLSLAREIRGWLDMDEAKLRELFGHTNVNVMLAKVGRVIEKEDL